MQESKKRTSHRDCQLHLFCCMMYPMDTPEEPHLMPQEMHQPKHEVIYGIGQYPYIPGIPQCEKAVFIHPGHRSKNHDLTKKEIRDAIQYIGEDIHPTF